MGADEKGFPIILTMLCYLTSFHIFHSESWKFPFPFGEQNVYSNSIFKCFFSLEVGGGEVN